MARRTPRIAIAATLVGGLLLPALATVTWTAWRRSIPSASQRLGVSLDVANARESRRCWAPARADAPAPCQAVDMAERLAVWGRREAEDVVLAEAALRCPCTANVRDRFLEDLSRRPVDAPDVALQARSLELRLRLVHRLAIDGDLDLVRQAAGVYTRFVAEVAPEQGPRAVATLEALARTPSPLARGLVRTVLDDARSDASLAPAASTPSSSLPESLVAGLRAARRARVSDVLDACAPDGFGCAHALLATGHLDRATLERAMREHKQLDRDLLTLARSLAALPAPEPVPVEPEAPRAGGLDAPPVRGRVTATAVESRGALTAADARRVARRHRAELELCYEDALRSSPRLEGSLTIIAIVSTSGIVMSSSVASVALEPFPGVASTAASRWAASSARRRGTVRPTADATVAVCFATALRRWSYPARRGGPTLIRHTFALAPAPAEPRDARRDRVAARTSRRDARPVTR